MSIEDFRRELELSRAAISRDYASLRSELDFVAKAKRGVAKKPLPWLGGAAALGYLLAGRRRKRKERRKKARQQASDATESAARITVLGVLIATFRFLLPVLKPMISSYAAKRLGAFAASKF